MKQQITLSIPLPCSEKWDEFLPVKDGAYCQRCCKTIIDFTKMSDDEVIRFFSNKSPNTCGRFREDQIRLYTNTAPIEPGFPLLKAGILSLFMLLINDRLQAQRLSKAQVELTQTKDQTIRENHTRPNYTIKGIVREKEGNLPMPGVNVLLKGTEKGIATNIDGKFEFPVTLKDGDVLVFSFIGYKTQELVVTNVGPVDISLDVDLDLEMLEIPFVMGEVNVHDDSSHLGLRKLVSKIKSLF